MGDLVVSGLGVIGSSITGGLLNGIQTLTEAVITGELSTTELWVSMAVGFGLENNSGYKAYYPFKNSLRWNYWYIFQK